MMQRLLKFLDTRIGDENLKIEELAESVNIGRTVFYGKIKTLVGMSPRRFPAPTAASARPGTYSQQPHEFLSDSFCRRILRPEVFYEMLQKETGMTPSEFRSKNQSSDNDA